MSNETSPGLAALDNYLLQREVLRRVAEDRANGSPSALEAMLAHISAHATSEAAERQSTAEHGAEATGRGSDRRRRAATRCPSNRTGDGRGEER
jgi:hypothetical protein